MVHKARGRARQREDNLTEPGSFMPANVSISGSDAALHPHTKLADLLADGAEVDVTLQTEVPLDAGGTPEISHWSALAFCYSEAGQQRLAAVEKRRREAELAAQAEADRKRAAEIEAGVGWESGAVKKLMAEQFDSPEQIAAALEDDWKQMSFKGVKGLSSAIDKDVPHKIEAIKRAFVDAFVDLNDAFKHYSAARRLVFFFFFGSLHRGGLFSIGRRCPAIGTPLLFTAMGPGCSFPRICFAVPFP